MKHLLSLVVAALCIACPATADSRDVVASVRFVDHEGNGISGLKLRMHWRDDGADPLTNWMRNAEGQFASRGAITDASGVATFLFFTDFNDDDQVIGPDAQAVVYPSFYIPAWVHEPQDEPTLDANGADHSFFDRERRFRRDRQRAEYLRHIEIQESYPLRAYYRFTREELLSNTAVIRVPEAVTVTVAYSEQFQQDSEYRPSVQANAAFLRSGTRSSERRILPIPKGEDAQIGFIGLLAENFPPSPIRPCYLLEYTAQQTESDVRIEWPLESEQPFTLAKIHYTAKPWQEKVITAAFVQVNGETAFKVFLAYYQDDRRDGYEFPVPAGDYAIVRDADWNSPVGPNEWRPGSVFDTMLRLRRGEDLPHLKRITIPEGATVELSSEDFLDPSSKSENATP